MFTTKRLHQSVKKSRTTR